MTITEKDVLHVAKLARLELTDAEVETMVRDLGSILEYVDQLGELDTTGISATSYVAVEAAPFRTDTVEPSLDNSRVLDQSPRHADGSFAVVGFVDEG